MWESTNKDCSCCRKKTSLHSRNTKERVAGFRKSETRARHKHACRASLSLLEREEERSENESMQLTLFMLVLMSKPSTKAVPPDMVSSPVNILKVVVFPAPLIPRRPKHSLMGIPRLKRSTATNGPRPRSQKKRYRCHHNISACYHRVSLLAIISVFWLVATISV